MRENYTYEILTQRPGRMSLGLADRQGNLLDDMEQFCNRTLPERSI
jgi:hypothetical protein